LTPAFLRTAAPGPSGRDRGGRSALDKRVRILGWVHVVLGGAGLLLGLALCVAILADPHPANRRLIEGFGTLFVTLSAAYFVPSFAGGLALLRGKAWGRVVIWAESALLAPMLPVGTVLAGLAVWALLPRGGPAEGDGGFRAFTRMLARARRPALIALTAIASLGAIVGLGYLFRDQIENVDPTSPVVAIGAFAVGLIAVVAVGMQLGWAGGGGMILSPQRARLRREGEREAARVAAEHKARLARLAADPVKAKYAADMERGEYWSDEGIAYDLDREARATCEHLRPIEGAMREAGLKVRWWVEGHASCECIVNEAALNLPAGGPVTFNASIEMGGRAYEDAPVAEFRCGACNSSIRVHNQHDAWPGIPVFPSGDEGQ
jgi:hypothetical protein